MSRSGLSWVGIVRLGLVQMALGAIVVLTTSTINRVMVVELALPAMLPGALVALHYLIQMSRPRFGYGSDVGGRRTPWIVGGMLFLAAGGIGASVGTALMTLDTATGTVVAFISFVVIGIGVGASGTSLLALLAKRVEPGRRAAAATIVWVMMIAGFALTAGAAGHFLDPFSPARLVGVTTAVATGAVLLTLLAIRGLETGGIANEVVPAERSRSASRQEFRRALAEVWAERDARRFTIFVFVSMLAYSTQDLILEPFAGIVFGMTPGESTKLSGVHHGGVLMGMLLVAVTGTLMKNDRSGLLRVWMVGGCIASGAALAAIAFGGFHAETWPLRATVLTLGVSNGAFAVAAIGTMMTLAGRGRQQREGLRMGLWGAAQAIAFGLGGFAGTVAIDVARQFLENPAAAYALVFGCEAALFVLAAVLGASVNRDGARAVSMSGIPVVGDAGLVELARGRS